MKTTTKKMIAVILILATTGCATLFTGTSDSVYIQSDPPDAKVYIDGTFMGNTPTSLSLSRDKDYNFILKKDGFEAATSKLTRKFNYVSLLNMMGIIWWIVDIATGAMWKFDRKAVSVNLQKELKSSSNPSHTRGKILTGSNLTTTPFDGKIAILELIPTR